MVSIDTHVVAARLSLTKGYVPYKVKPVFKDYPYEVDKLVFVYRLFLIEGSLLHKMSIFGN